MVPILLGAFIEAIGFILLMIGAMKQGMPPGPMWLVPAIVLIVFGNGLVVYTVFSRARAGRKK